MKEKNYVSANFDAKEALENVGLGEKEAEVYVYLLKHGESKSGIICEKTKIPSSRIYFLLEELIEKGLVSFKMINNIKYFRANEPETLRDLFEKKEERLSAEKHAILASIPKLQQIKNQKLPFTDFRYFSGFNGIKSAYEEIMNLWKISDEVLVVSAPVAFDKIDAFFMQVFNKKRIKDKVKLKIIITKEAEEYGEKREKLKLTEVKYSQMKTKVETLIFSDYLMLVDCGKEPYALLIKDEDFTETFREYFRVMWK